VSEERVCRQSKAAPRPDEDRMTRAAIVLLAVGLAACGSSRSKDDEPSTIPPPQPVGQSTDARLNDLQTSLTELLERLDVLNARIARLEASQGEQPAASSDRVTTLPVPTPQAGLPAPHRETKP